MIYICTGAKIEDTSNVEAEAYAILQVATHSSQTKQSKVIIQTNSLLIQKFLNREWNYPWNLVDYVDHIWAIMKNKQVQYQHILREGNQLANHLANLAIDKGYFTIKSFQQLEIIGRKILNSDKLQYPYIRLSAI